MSRSNCGESAHYKNNDRVLLNKRAFDAFRNFGTSEAIASSRVLRLLLHDITSNPARRNSSSHVDVFWITCIVQSQMSPISSLPDEVLYSILARLGVSDLLRCAQVRVALARCHRHEQHSPYLLCTRLTGTSVTWLAMMFSSSIRLS